MVDAILDATADRLVTHGYRKMTTNEIARRAGVSVGSLYQYFSSKEALVVALINRHYDRLVQRLSESAAAMLQAPIGEAARAVIHAMVEAHRANPRLHAALFENGPFGLKHARDDAPAHRFTAQVSAFLRVRHADVDVRDPDLAAVVLVQCSEGLTRYAFRERTELVENGGLEAEILRVVLRYLGCSDQGSPKPSEA